MRASKVLPKLNKISKIKGYFRNGESEFVIQNKYFTAEIMWEFENMDLVFVKEDGTRTNYSKTDYSQQLKNNIESTIYSYLTNENKLIQIDNLLYSYFVETNHD